MPVPVLTDDAANPTRTLYRHPDQEKSYNVFGPPRSSDHRKWRRTEKVLGKLRIVMATNFTIFLKGRRSIVCFSLLETCYTFTFHSLCSPQRPLLSCDYSIGIVTRLPDDATRHTTAAAASFTRSTGGSREAGGKGKYKFAMPVPILIGFSEAV